MEKREKIIGWTLLAICAFILFMCGPPHPADIEEDPCNKIEDTK